MSGTLKSKGNGGTLYLVGVGPGDPELLTLKAARLLATAEIVVYPVANDDLTMGFDIVRAHIGPRTILEEVHLSMAVGLEREPVYDEAARRIAAHLDQGRSVAYVCAGDPLLYGTAIYLLSRLGGKHRVEIVPGITSITAAAAAVPLRLSMRNESLTILAAPAPDIELRPRLALGGGFAILKIGRHFDRIRGLLGEAGLAGRAVLVDHATTSRQTIAPLLDLPPGGKQYFSLILVPPSGAAP